MVLVGGQIDGGVSVRALCVHRRVTTQQRRHNASMPLLGGDHERGEARRACHVDVGPQLQPRLHFLYVPFRSRAQKAVHPSLVITAARVGSVAASVLSLVAAPPLLLGVAEPPALRAKEPARERRGTCEPS